MFTKKTNQENSRIPVPASPTPLRRQSSLRIRGEKKDTTTPYLSRDANHAKDNKSHSVALKRGSSFMERGERRDHHGVRGLPNRPHNIKTDVKCNTKFVGPTTPQSPARIRSLVSCKWWFLIIESIDFAGTKIIYL